MKTLILIVCLLAVSSCASSAPFVASSTTKATTDQLLGEIDHTLKRPPKPEAPVSSTQTENEKLRGLLSRAYIQINSLSEDLSRAQQSVNDQYAARMEAEAKIEAYAADASAWNTLLWVLGIGLALVLAAGGAYLYLKVTGGAVTLPASIARFLPRS